MGAWAAQKIDNTNLLLELGAKPWEYGPTGHNSFDLLALQGHEELLKWVLNIWKTQVRIPETTEKALAIHYACYVGNTHIVKLFLTNKVPPNVICNKIDKATPLHYAVLSNKPELVELLCKW